MSKKIKKIAVYGKGGIGKSTTASNISAALSKLGYKVMQFGCDPKSDSTNTLRNGLFIPTILDTLNSKTEIDMNEIIHKGFNGVYCVEAGGPAPGVGCAGRGIITAVELMNKFNVFERLDLDVIIYDVLGDVVCGGFAMPIREGIAEHIFVVSSSDFMSMYAANNLFKGIKKYSDSGGGLLGGIIANLIDTPVSKEIISDFSTRTGTQIIECIPRSLTVSKCELVGKTTIEDEPNSVQAEIYIGLAKKIMGHDKSEVPIPMETGELREWASGWAEKLLRISEDNTNDSQLTRGRNRYVFG